MIKIKEIKQYIKYEWVKNKKPFVIESVGVPCGIAAALTLTIFGNEANLGVLFSLYLISSALLCYSAYLRHASWWVLLNSVFILINIIGLGKYILGGS